MSRPVTDANPFVDLGKNTINQNKSQYNLPVFLENSTNEALENGKIDKEAFCAGVTVAPHGVSWYNQKCYFPQDSLTVRRES